MVLMQDERVFESSEHDISEGLKPISAVGYKRKLVLYFQAWPRCASPSLSVI